MTHTNHRLVDNSEKVKDYIILAMPAKGVNDKDGAEKLKEAFRIMLRYNPLNGGGIKAGNMINNTPEEIIETISPDTPMIHGLFINEEDMLSALKAIKERDLGISIVVTGEIKRVRELAGTVALKPHSIAYSMGIFGNIKLLPSREIMEITTMCGHGLIPVSLAEKVLADVQSGKMTLRGGANELGRHCVCGIFNTERAMEIIATVCD